MNIYSWYYQYMNNVSQLKIVSFSLQNFAIAFLFKGTLSKGFTFFHYGSICV